MIQPQLDPNPDNILGKGILPPEEEEWLLSRGIVYAEWFCPPDIPPFLVTTHKPFDLAIAQMFEALDDSPFLLSGPPGLEPVAA